MTLQYDSDKQTIDWNGEIVNLGALNISDLVWNPEANMWQRPKEPTLTEKLTPKVSQGVPGPQGRPGVDHSTDIKLLHDRITNVEKCGYSLDEDVAQLKMDLSRAEDASSHETKYIHERISKAQLQSDSQEYTQEHLCRDIPRLEDDDSEQRRRLGELEGKIEYLEGIIEKKLDKPSECAALNNAEAYMDDYNRARELSAQKKFARKQGVRKKLERLKGISEKKESKSYTVHKVVALVTLFSGILGAIAMVV